MPYFVLDRFHIPGVRGLFVAAVFAGSLRYHLADIRFAIDSYHMVRQRYFLVPQRFQVRQIVL